MSYLLKAFAPAILGFLALSAATPVFADTRGERLSRLGVEIDAASSTADSLHRQGQYKAALIQTERLEKALDTYEVLSFGGHPEDLVERDPDQVEAYRRLDWQRGQIGLRYRMHGCFRKAAALSERQLTIVRQVPELEASPNHFRLLVGLELSAEGLGDFEKAIRIREEIVDMFHDESAPPLNVPYSLARLAWLHFRNGDLGKARALMTEARVLEEESERKKPDTDIFEGSTEARFLTIEGRISEAEAILEEFIDSETPNGEAANLSLAWAYSQLAVIHGALGETEARISALEVALNYQTETNGAEKLFVVESAHRLATALREAGRTGAANALRDKYQLCFD